MSEMNWCAHCDDKRDELDTLRERVRELEAEQDRIYKGFCGRDGMHLPLFEALEERFKALWENESKHSD